MFKKFMALFTWWKSRDRGDTLKTPDTPWPRMVGHNPRPADTPWPDPAGINRRIQPEQMQPFNTGTPHSRMHDLITAGKPDALIAIELGVEIAAVRNYRHIISARGRETARKRAAEAQVPRMLARGELDVDIASKLGLDLATVKNVRDAVVAGRRRETARYERVPAALLRRAERLDERVIANQAAMYASVVVQPSLSSLSDRLKNLNDDRFSAGQGGDFGGAGATGSWDGEQP